MTKRDKLREQIDEQARWIIAHGGDLAGYVRRYGSKNDPNHYGDGGEAIYEADYNALARLVSFGLWRGIFRF